MRGLIVRSQSGFFTVKTEEGLLTCQLRGRLKKGPRLGDVASIGDWVEVKKRHGGSGVIEAVEPRQRLLSRSDPTPRGNYQQIIIANPDQAVFVFSCEKPPPRYGMLDRFLVIAEKQNIPAMIVANKTDLVGMEEAKRLFDYYPAIGYPVIYTSIINGVGIDELHAGLMKKISVFAGPSGVGKSSLLNIILPGLNITTAQVSQATDTGKHTTVVREMYPLPDGGYIADTPGLRTISLWDTELEELDGYFPEFRERVSECQFNNCTHDHEPGCAIKAALANGKVHPNRYRSYISIRKGEEED
ncbi:MAG: ribosome small subunit-dependent GTPase A [Anaerolineales bacterium]|nr:ribosome small subunit-dependent GTPase A [Anaerolineales bacterium]